MLADAFEQLLKKSEIKKGFIQGFEQRILQAIDQGKEQERS